MSKLCLRFVLHEFVQTLSNFKILILFEDHVGQFLDKPWISMSNLCPSPNVLDNVLTDIILLLDSIWTYLVHGQTLDRVLTDLGHRLDFLSNLCPTTL